MGSLGELSIPLGNSTSVAVLGNNRLTTGEETIDRNVVNNNTVLTLSNQSMRLAYFTARKTEAITQVKVYTGTPAAGATPTLCRMGLYTVAANGDIALVASTVNDTTLFAATNTAYTKALSATYTKVAGQRYAMAALVVTGAAAPVLISNLIAGGTNISDFVSSAPALAGTVTGQADLPASVVAGSILGTVSGCFYGVLLP